MSKPRRRVRPADVIEGKTRPGPRALVSLIAEVNPTGRGLTPSEQARRYAEKSALQSLLLRWHGDAFLPERTDDEGVVLIRHRHFDECACHGHVSSLDDDGRAWVWGHLDDDRSEAEEDARRADERRARRRDALEAHRERGRAPRAGAGGAERLRLRAGGAAPRRAFELSAGEVSASARRFKSLAVRVDALERLPGSPARAEATFSAC